MKALAIRRYKAPMEMMEVPGPEPGAGDLLVRVRAASVNPLDHKIASGGVKVLIPYSFPLILGNDLAGDVEAVGPGVTKFKVGDAVYSRLDKDRAPSLSMPWYARAPRRKSPRVSTTCRPRRCRWWGSPPRRR